MDYRSHRTIDRAASVGMIALVMTFSCTSMAQTSATDMPVPLAFEPRSSAPSSEPIRPVASSWGAYAIETHRRIERHLRANRDKFKFRSDLYVEVWIDPNGRVIRTRVTEASNSPAANAIAGPDFPPGLILPAPAKDMPQPIKVKINADR